MNYNHRRRNTTRQSHRAHLQRGHRRKHSQIKEKATHRDIKSTEFQVNETRKETPHIIVKNLSILNKEKIQNAVREKPQVILRGKPNRVAAGFSVES